MLLDGNDGYSISKDVNVAIGFIRTCLVRL